MPYPCSPWKLLIGNKLRIRNKQKAFHSFIENLAALDDLTSLKIQAYGNPEPVDISALESLKSLIDLEISGVNFVTAFGLNLPQLTTLKIRRARKLEDISSLPSLVPNLTTLDLRWCKNIEEVSPLKSLKYLESLDLSHTRVADISELRRLKLRISANSLSMIFRELKTCES